ncbi:hypothetical protein [Caballeronia glebae]|uniref:hypothetical protein n=1 Tax=Caballeronia glebae TaxID=1777143 RepID=UPI001F25EE1D|nr:hypothetical protein [Caballeronia glebae]
MKFRRRFLDAVQRLPIHALHLRRAMFPLADQVVGERDALARERLQRAIFTARFETRRRASASARRSRTSTCALRSVTHVIADAARRSRRSAHDRFDARAIRVGLRKQIARGV